jgi:hypothetical protein
MTRPSRNIDIKLIELGKKKIAQDGIANLSIRSICIESGINLGMFFYYFKSKENFIKILLQSYAENLYAFWFKESEGAGNSLEKLKKALQLSVKLFKEKRGVIEIIFKDVNFHDEFYMDIFKGIYKDWYAFYCGMIDKCKECSYIDKNIDTGKVVAILCGSVMQYAKHCEIYDYDNFYGEIKELIDFIIEKIK